VAGRPAAGRAALDRETEVRILPGQLEVLPSGRTLSRCRGFLSVPNANIRSYGWKGRAPKSPPGVTREKVRALLADGRSQQEIATSLGVTKGTVAFHVRRLQVPPDERFARRYDWQAIRALYESGVSYRECARRFGFSRDAWYAAVDRGDVIPRPVAMPIDELLVKGRVATARRHLKARLIQAGLKEQVCELCGLTEWHGETLSMHLHHVNGDGHDNRLENLQLRCPNCHSQTDTYSGRNRHRRPHLRLVEDEGVA
jgi:5-methylcytosine-specific restriction endonuclease McrA